jgi:hypothetical protein
MSTIFIILMGLAMIATLVVLITGVIAMLKGGEFNQKHGNKLMNARVFLQGLAIFFLALAIMSQNQN